MAILRHIAISLALIPAILIMGGCGDQAKMPAKAALPPLQGESRPFIAAVDRPFAPDYAFQTLEGVPMRLADLKGKTVLLNLWATWCAPCVREMPALARLQAMRGEKGLHVAAVSLDRGGRTQIEPFIATHGLNGLPIYLDTTMAAMRTLGAAEGLPLSILIDAEGREMGRLAGAAAWDGPEALALIDAALARQNR
jgi:thiol-disulfide isomerase/thioredoxin